MQRQQVVSTSISSIGYDPASRVLEIEFTNGAVYEYFAVPADLHAGLLVASSHGQYFDRFIKKAGFRYQRTQ